MTKNKWHLRTDQYKTRVTKAKEMLLQISLFSIAMTLFTIDLLIIKFQCEYNIELCSIIGQWSGFVSTNVEALEKAELFLQCIKKTQARFGILRQKFMLVIFLNKTAGINFRKTGTNLMGDCTVSSGLTWQLVSPRYRNTFQCSHYESNPGGTWWAPGSYPARWFSHPTALWTWHCGPHIRAQKAMKWFSTGLPPIRGRQPQVMWVSLVSRSS